MCKDVCAELCVLFARHHLLCAFGSQDLSLGWQFCSQAIWGILLPLSRPQQDYKRVLPCLFCFVLFYTWVLEIKLRLPCLYGKWAITSDQAKLVRNRFLSQKLLLLSVWLERVAWFLSSNPEFVSKIKHYQMTLHTEKVRFGYLVLLIWKKRNLFLITP